MQFLKNIFFFISDYVWFICQKAVLGFNSACMSLQDCAYFKMGNINNKTEVTWVQNKSQQQFSQDFNSEKSPAGLMSTTEWDADLKMLNIWKDKSV